MRMSTQERRERILSELFAKKHVIASDLAMLFDVSEATVRRDLHALAEAEQAELVHGGAKLPRNGDFSFRSKAMRNVEAKHIVGELAAGMVEDGDQIFLDSGTTCFEMAGLIKRKRALQVIVNSARLALELDTPNLSVIMLGGQYRPDRMDTVGPLATNALGQLRGYKAFIGADGLSMDFGPAAGDIESAHLYGLAVRNAQEATLLVDQSKFFSPSLCKIVDWDAISRVVTDRPPSREWIDFLAERSIRMVYPLAEAESMAG